MRERIDLLPLRAGAEHLDDDGEQGHGGGEAVQTSLHAVLLNRGSASMRTLPIRSSAPLTEL